ncbi:MAG: endolytic transglycosylase MltG [Bacteroidetes bacterium]|nr:endolytic transglycosylase MltG [Bacteroidota bacterium]
MTGKHRALVFAGITGILLSLVVLWYYIGLTKPMIDLKGKKYCFFYIHTGSDFKTVKDSLVRKGYLTDPDKFEWLAQKKRYDQHVKPGRYRLVNGMRNNVLVNLLRSGNQEPVRIIIQNVRTREELAGKIGRQLEVDSTQLITLFNDPSFLAGFGLSPPTLLVLFIPNTYEFFWNTSAGQLFKRMQQEYELFWTPGRKRKADSLQLSVAEVVTLASIVEKESNKKAEKPVIAGVYLNRLKNHIPLQADPTVIFAWNDYRIRRVLKVHTEIKSPYNTYYHSGLPPGPICLPSVSSIDAVLSARNHAYLYFCAREDLSGYHNFAVTLDEHSRNARRYQKALNKMNIK